KETEVQAGLTGTVSFRGPSERSYRHTALANAGSINGMIAFSDDGMGRATTVLTGAIGVSRAYASCVAVRGKMITVARCTTPPRSAPPKSSSSQRIMGTSASKLQASAPRGRPLSKRRPRCHKDVAPVDSVRFRRLAASCRDSRVAQRQSQNFRPHVERSLHL